MGEVNGRIFLNNSSIGIYPDIVVEREALRRQGYRKWTAFAVATVKILRHYRGVVVRITAEESTHVVRTPFLFVGNNQYHVEGRQLGARDRLDGGRLFAYLAPRVHARDLPKLLASALIGREHDTLESFGAVALQVDTPGRRRLRVATDGEVAVMSTPLQYRVRPRCAQGDRAGLKTVRTIVHLSDLHFGRLDPRSSRRSSRRSTNWSPTWWRFPETSPSARASASSWRRAGFWTPCPVLTWSCRAITTSPCTTSGGVF